jgi:hypothetical protein
MVPEAVYSEDLAPVAHNIITSSIIQCKYPRLYKQALITPVPKITPPKNIETDFRQISVLPQLANVLEKIQLQLNCADLTLKDNQHAFLKGHSTISALIEISQKWFDETENTAHGRKGIHAIFIDFSKPFDMVDNRILLSKLASMNLTKYFWLWIRDFLSTRNQQVMLLQMLSSSAPCPAGVPQGSVISPMLFNVYIDYLEDEIPANLTVDTSKYADDCTLDQAVGAGEISHVDQALDIIQNWSVSNKMTINVKKTKDMWICFTESVLEPPPVYIGDELVERVDKFKLLGMGLQNNLKWNNHVETVIQKAVTVKYIS